ncbi:hypothetical protein D3C75_868870 [compost metagenome]
MANHSFHFILIHQTVSDGHRLFRLTSIITLHQFDFFAVDPACGVDVFSGLRRAMPVLIAISGVRPGEWPGNTNHNIGLGGERRHQTTCQHKRKRTSD